MSKWVVLLFTGVFASVISFLSLALNLVPSFVIPFVGVLYVIHLIYTLGGK